MTEPASRGAHPELLYPTADSVPRATGAAPPGPSHAEFLAVLRAARDRISVLARGELTTLIPDCPGWTLGELLRHLGAVSHRVSECLRSGRLPEQWPTEAPGWVPVAEWYAESSRLLLTALSDRDPDERCATWWPPSTTVGFWYRRMAHEYTVHRVDAESTTGAATPIDPVLAVDGCDEVLERRLAYFGVAQRLSGAGERIVVRAGSTEWTVTLTADGPAIARGGTDGPDATVSGDQSDVYRWLWGRTADVNTDGDRNALAALSTRLRLTTE